MVHKNGLIISFEPDLLLAPPKFDSSTAMWTIPGKVFYFDGLDANLNVCPSLPFERLATSLVLHKDYVNNIDKFPWKANKGFKPILNIKQTSLFGLVCWDVGHVIELKY